MPSLNMRGCYVEYHNGHYLMWGPDGFIGSARNAQELAGTLERMSTARGAAQEAQSKRTTWRTCVPHFSADDTERERQIQDYLAHHNPRRASPSASAKKSGAQAPVNIDDLDLDI